MNITAEYNQTNSEIEQAKDMKLKMYNFNILSLVHHACILLFNAAIKLHFAIQYGNKISFCYSNQYGNKIAFCYYGNKSSLYFYFFGILEKKSFPVNLIHFRIVQNNLFIIYFISISLLEFLFYHSFLYIT